MDKKLQDILNELETGVELGIKNYNKHCDIKHIDICINELNKILVLLESNINDFDIAEVYASVSGMKDGLKHRYNR